MSIESLLQAHIEALQANTAAVNLLTESLYGRALPKKEAEIAQLKDDNHALECQLDAQVDALELQKSLTEVVARKTKAKNEEPITEDDVKIAEKDTVKSSVPFGTVRELVLKLSSGHRDAIKAINQKHGIARLSALLKDENDFASVIDQAKLESVYSDLQALEA